MNKRHIHNHGFRQTVAVLLMTLMMAGQASAQSTGVKVHGNVYGGGNLANVGQSVTVNVSGGEVDGDVYGGGAKAHTNTANWNGAALASTYATIVNLTNGTIGRNVYGGGLGEKAVEDNPATSDVDESYAGIAALVYGDVTVNIGATDGAETPTYTGNITIGGSVFGCNNLNGTPKGDVLVNVYKTAHTSGDNNNLYPPDITDFDLEDLDESSDARYAIKAVYGGGNLAHYTPVAPTGSNPAHSTTVHVYGCEENTVKAVYGGGNAADVGTADVEANTNVIIEGGRFYTVFGGGNGKSTESFNNPGANIKGTASTDIQGGLFYQIFGGSDSKGDVNVVQLSINPLCETMMINESFGGANMSPLTGDVITNLTCSENSNRITIGNFYGGSNQADITGNVTLNVYGGSYGNVFGGSKGVADDPDTQADESISADITGNVTLNLYGGTMTNAFGGSDVNGNIGGKITVNVLDYQSATCPLVVTNIYGAGNLTAYTPDLVNSQVISSPEVNVIHMKSGNSITGSVYGGGKGDDNHNALVTANPVVNIGYDATTMSSLIPKGYLTAARLSSTDDLIATVSGNVYGGGDLAQVAGSTTVNLRKANSSVSTIYGGGNEANVSGNTAVNVNAGTVTHDVYGGGALANVGTNASGNTPATTHQVTIAGGTVTGNVYGGGLGRIEVQAVADDPSTDENEAVEGVTAVAALVNGVVTVTINGGTVANVFGCNNENGSPQNGVTVNINNSVTGSVYGGGNLAAYNPTSHSGAYPAVNINNGTVGGDVFGGGLGASAKVYSNPVVTVGDLTEGHESYAAVVTGNVYGGGSAAMVGDNASTNNTTVLVQKANSSVTNVFGGGMAAGVTGATNVTIASGSVTSGVYGGCNTSGTVSGTATVNLTGGTVGTSGTSADIVFGGGFGSGTTTTTTIVNVGEATTTTGENPTTTYSGSSTIYSNVYGGSALGTVGTATVNLYKATTLNGDVFGGGKGEKMANSDISANVTTATVKLYQLDIPTQNIYGGCNVNGTAASTRIDLYGGSVTSEGNTTYFGKVNDVYGGGKGQHTSVTTSTLVNVGQAVNTGEATVNGDIYGGSEMGAVNAPTVNIYAAALLAGNVFGGGKGINDTSTPANNVSASVTGLTTVNMAGATVTKAIYGGCNANGTSVNTEVNVTGGTVGVTTPVNGVQYGIFGGGYGVLTSVTGNVVVNIGKYESSSISGNADIKCDVYGGSAKGSVNTDTSNTTTVNLLAGTVSGNVYGGGLGVKSQSENIEAQVNGTVLVSLNEHSGTCKIGGSVFGCNNVNGSPRGQVTVHVYKTEPRDGQTSGEYDLAAVYGGGNEADYVPTASGVENTTQVIIEGCNQTSINNVYGGGNAAAVPGTEVWVLGTEIINNVYGGGNGELGAAYAAHVGFHRTPDTTHTDYTEEEPGSYKTEVNLVAGTINNVYGGSNSNGDIRNGADVKTATQSAYTAKYGSTPAPDCCNKLVTQYIYGGGSQAEMSGDVNVILECMPDDYVDAVYGGAANATINGNVSLTVTSGKFGRVFGGNNRGGSINGTISVVAKEEGCKPLEIGELYGGGNQAPYSKYGCEKDGDNWVPNTSGKDHTIPEGGTQPARYAIDVLVESCTSIGKIFGGGNLAEVIGNTHVEINMFHGSATDANPSTNRPIGTIGQVFGGGNQAKVTGNTTVDIGTDGETVDPQTNTVLEEHKKGVVIASSDQFINPDYNPNDLENHPLRKSITAGIYGGGNAADVDGNTEVNIGTANQSLGINITGDIFGGGLGETTHVTGDVVANIGKRTGTTTHNDETDEDETTYTYEGYATIMGDVYGGSAKGKVNSYLNNSNVETLTTGATTQVNFYGGTISGTGKGNIYGGGLGDASNAADVYGGVTVNVYGGTANNVFGCNNVNGTPKSTVAVNINGGAISQSVYGGGNQAIMDGSPVVNVTAGTIGTDNEGGAVYGNVYGGGLGSDGTGDQAVLNKVKAGLVKGNTRINVSGGTILHNIYGGGAYGSVGTYTYDNSTSMPTGLATANTGKAEVYITGGTIGTDGKENGMVFGSSRGDVGAPNAIHDKLAWVYDADVRIGTSGANTGPTIKGSVYGGGENGHNYHDAVVYIYSGMIGIDAGNDVTYHDDPDDNTKVTYTGKDYNYSYRGNVYGSGCGTDKYDSDNNGTKDAFNPLAGIVQGDATITMTGGTVVHNIYGAGAMGSVGTASAGGVTTISISGGAVGVSGTIGGGCVFGAARGDAAATSNEYALVRDHTLVNISGGTVYGNVYGGGELGCVGRYVISSDMRNFYWTDTPLANINPADASTYTYNNTGVCNVNITGSSSSIKGHVFGGGKGKEDTFWCEKGIAYKTNVTITNGTVDNNVYGGGQVGRVETDATVKIGPDSGTGSPEIKGDVFGAGAGVDTHGYSALVRGNTYVTVQSDAKIHENVYGGGELAAVGKYYLVDQAYLDSHPGTALEIGMPYSLVDENLGVCNVTIKGDAEIGYNDTGHVYGGGKGKVPTYYLDNTDSYSSTDDMPKRMMSYNDQRYTADNDNLWDYSDASHQYVWEYFDTRAKYHTFLETLALATRTEVSVEGSAKVNGSVYGGSQSGFVQHNTSVTIKESSTIGKSTGGTVTGGDVYGGGLGLEIFEHAGRVSGNSTVNINGGNILNSVYGGGAYGYVMKDVLVSVADGTVNGDVYGGGALANTNTDNWNSDTETLANNTYSEATGLTPGTSSVTGLYTRSGSSEPYTYTLITGVNEKAVSGTTYYENAAYKTIVSLTGGTVGNAYGGGLGRLTSSGVSEVAAMVYGDVTVTVDGTVFHQQTESEKEAVTYKDEDNQDITTKVTKYGRVFGANNVNGTPKGNILVHVKQTVPENGGAHEYDHYEIHSVYGGGNQADYLPVSGRNTQVLIEDCGVTSIQYVYGGGNSASVPQTLVTVNGCFEIGMIFGGGNGEDPVQNTSGVWEANPGADVKHSDGTAGTGTINAHGGIIRWLYGGSNKKGLCGTISENLKSENPDCPLKITNVYGAGKNADVEEVFIVAKCPGENVEYLYGGSYNAHITRGVTLTLIGGQYKNVYGGNDSGGTIGGDIEVNIQETLDCAPIIIDNLYGGGNNAEYPGNNGTGGSITVNVKSCTYIGNIYGGGRGEGAIVNGNTAVNLNMTKGLWARSLSNQTFTLSKDKADFEGKTDAQIMAALEAEMPNIDFTSATLDKTNYRINDCKVKDEIGTIGNIYGGGDEASVNGSAMVNIGNVASIDIMQHDNNGVPVKNTGTTDSPEYTPIFDNEGKLKSGFTYDDIAYISTPVLGANITGNVFGGGNKAEVTSNTYVNISASMTPVLDQNDDPTGDYTYTAVNLSENTGFEGISIAESVYGGGCEADVLSNTFVRMDDGYVFNGIFGGGYSGSVGTVTERIAKNYDGTNHDTSHDGCVGGKPSKFKEDTGKCTVVVNGGQIGPDEVATLGMNRKTNNKLDPVPHGWVWGGGCGIVDDPANDPDSDFRTYVESTDVTIGGTAFIMESVIGGGEFGRVLGDTKVTIEGNCQIGAGYNHLDNNGKPIPYTTALWKEAAAAVAAGVASAINTVAVKMPECSHFPYQSPYLPYDPYYDYSSTKIGTASTEHPSDGKTWIGCVFGGGSGYMPYTRKNNEGNITGYDWIPSAGLVEGNAVVNITGGHILTNVYGGNEVTDVLGKCTVNMSGGTIGVPRTLEQIAAHPVSCYLFGAGKGDQRSYFDTFTNVGSVEVKVSGGIIFGSVFGGSEDGHVQGDVTVEIEEGTSFTIGGDTYTKPIIGTWGTSYVDGNVFGGGRGFSGDNVKAGTVGGNVDIEISGGTMLGSIYGGGRLASVGLNFKDPAAAEDGQLKEDDSSGTYGHVTLNISGGTIGKAGVTGNGAEHSGNVYGGCMGRITLIDGVTINPIWPELAQSKFSTVNIYGNDTHITRNVYGGGEFGVVRENAKVTIGGKQEETGTTITEVSAPTIDGYIYGGGHGSDDYQNPTTIDVHWGGTTRYFTYTPMQWTGCVGGNTTVNLAGGTVKRIYGGGELASVGVIDYEVTPNATGEFTYKGQKYSYTNMVKHESLTNGFGLSWPYKFTYVPCNPTGFIGGLATVNVTGGTVTEYVFGGGRGQVAFTGVNIDNQRYVEAFCANVRNTQVTIGTSGGSAATPRIGVEGTNTQGTVYGGAEDGHVYENANVTIHHGTIIHTVFGGGKGEGTYTATLLDPTDPGKSKPSSESVHSWTAGKVYGNTNVTVNGGSIGWFVYGGGNKASVGKGNYTGGSDDYSTTGYGETIQTALWTSSSEGDNAWQFLNSGKATVNLFGGTVGTATVGFNADGVPYGSVFGGSRGTAAMDVGALSPRYKYVPDFFLGYTNKTIVKIGKQLSDFSGEGAAAAFDAYVGPTIYGSVYGGGQDGHVRNSTEVKINKGSITAQNPDVDAVGRSGHVFGAGSGIGTYVDVNDGNKNKVSNASGSVTCTTLVEVNGGSITGNVYGGGALASVGPPMTGQSDYEDKEATETKKSVSYSKVMIEGGTIGGDVYGASRGPSATFLSQHSQQFNNDNPYDPDKFATVIWSDVLMQGATVNGSVYGGGEGGRVKKDTKVDLLGGTINGDAYGGGKGALGTDGTPTGTNAIAAHVGGNVAVNLGSESGSTATAFNITNYTEEGYTNVVKSGRVFGCNNLNGSPHGNVTVTVWKTVAGNTPRTAAEDPDNPVSARKDDGVAHTYELAAVYGGGNLADFSPTATGKKASVIIKTCGVSVQEVYGGGNAAAVPATDVLINGAYEIESVFGGGNGEDPYTLDGGANWVINPGANVNGNATTLLKGGYIHEAYGGSNSKGTISGDVSIDKSSGGACTLIVNDIYGAGKNADVEGDLILVMGCSESRTENVYGCSKNANVKGNVELTITSGEYGKVFGGNNESGSIFGHIIVNIEEVGCSPIIIDELYGCGREAPYSTFGYWQNGTVEETGKPNYVARTAADDEHTAVTFEGKPHTVPPYADPVVNIISATRIGKVFGGGLGSGAIVYGNPKVNINMIKGAWAGKEYTAPDNSKVTHPNNLGAIGAGYSTVEGGVFGGGNEAAVYGNTTMNIGTETEVYVVDLEKTGSVEGYYTCNEGVYTATSDATAQEGVYYYEKKTVEGANVMGNVYGGGNLADVGKTHLGTENGKTVDVIDLKSNTYVNIGANMQPVIVNNQPTGKYTYTPVAVGTSGVNIAGNVFGGGKGEAATSGDGAFRCGKAMVTDGTNVHIGNGTVGTLDSNNKLVEGTGNVYGGGQIGRVETDGVVMIGLPVGENETSAPVIRGNVFGGGKGVKTHGYAALLRGNTYVTVQSDAKVGRSVYGGGEIASVGKYNVADADYHYSHPEVAEGMPYSLGNEESGYCNVIVRGNAEIGPDNMQMYYANGDAPDDEGHVFGAGKGILPYEGLVGTEKPGRMTPGNTMEYYTQEEYGEGYEAAYLEFIESQALATHTEVLVDGNAFVKGSVYGGSLSGHVQHDTHVTIAGGQIGNGDGVNARYLETDWAGTTTPTGGWKECAHWPFNTNSNMPYDPYAIYSKEVDGKVRYYYDEARTEANYANGGSYSATDGHTYYGNVFGGGSGVVPYKPGMWHREAGTVGGNTVVDITGGHILTSVYGGNEHTDVGTYVRDSESRKLVANTGKCTVNMIGGTIGVPRTLEQIKAHPVTCYLFGAGKGDTRVTFNKWTNVGDTKVNISGNARIYGSTFGGGEDGHVLGDAVTNIGGSVTINNDTNSPYSHSNVIIGSQGLSGADGNVFGGGRGFSEEALTAGVVCGDVRLNIYNGKMLGSVFGGGRLASVGTHLASSNHSNYGKLIANGKNQVIDGTDVDASGVKHGGITINISGGTVGATDEQGKLLTSDYSIGDVFGGCKGSGNDKRFGIAKHTSINMTGGTVNGNVYGGGELGYVGEATYDNQTKVYTWNEEAAGGGLCTVGISGGSVAGHVFGAGKGLADDFDCEKALVRTTNVTISGTDTSVGGNVYGGGQIGRVDQHTVVTIGNSASEGAGVSGGTDAVILGNVLGAGAGVETHGYSALVRGNATVTVQGNAKVGKSVYGGGEIASVGRYRVDTSTGMPTTLVSGGECIVTVKGYAKVGPETGGNVFGAGMGVNPSDVAHSGFNYSDPTVSTGKPKRMTRYTNNTDYPDGAMISASDHKATSTTSQKTIWEYCENSNEYIWEYYTTQDGYFDYLQTLALATDTKVSVEGHATVKGSVYGGSESGFVQRDTEVKINGATIGTTDDQGNITTVGNIFGGGLGIKSNETAGRVRGSTAVLILDGTINGDVYGGGALGKSNTAVDNGSYPTAMVNLLGGIIKGDAYGGGLGDKATNTAADVGNTVVNLNGMDKSYYDAANATMKDFFNELVNKPEGVTAYPLKTNLQGCIVNRVFGANNVNGTPLGHAKVHVFATQSKQPSKTAIGSKFVREEYSDEAAVLYSHLTDTIFIAKQLTLTAVTSAMESLTASSSVESLRAALSTLKTSLDDYVNNAVNKETAQDNIDAIRYDVKAVFGGGNESDYVPASTNEFSEVIIDGCDLTCIEDVYGGGNAAATSATEVKINGCYMIDNVFGGGNGTVQAADVGYTGYLGTAKTNLGGGFIHKVFGGSNTNGNILHGSSVTSEKPSGETCDLKVSEVFGGGNVAPMVGGTEVVLDCMPNDWIDEIYAGAQNADVVGDVSLTITSGKFGRVFGGNKSGGKLDGGIVVNIEENPTCDTPIVIGELYGGGNEAPYSAYGYDSGGNLLDKDHKAHDAYPVVVHAKAFTSIGKIFGGGKGSAATLIGNPMVLVDEVAGGRTFVSDDAEVAPAVTQPDGTLLKTLNDDTEVMLYPCTGTLGVVGTIFGGGNEAQVNGDTKVYIASLEFVKMWSVAVGDDVSGYYVPISGNGTPTDPFVVEYTPEGEPKALPSGSKAKAGEVYCKKVIGADIRGNVYGGGNNAEVTGDTNVVIGRKEQ